MKKIDYIKATNRAKVSIALTILREVITGDEYLIDKKDFSVMKGLLRRIEERLYINCNMVEDNEI